MLPAGVKCLDLVLSMCLGPLGGCRGTEASALLKKNKNLFWLTFCWSVNAIPSQAPQLLGDGVGCWLWLPTKDVVANKRSASARKSRPVLKVTVTFVS